MYLDLNLASCREKNIFLEILISLAIIGRMLLLSISYTYKSQWALENLEQNLVTTQFMTLPRMLKFYITIQSLFITG